MKAMFALVENGVTAHKDNPQVRILVDLCALTIDPVAHTLLGHHAGMHFRRLPGARIAVLVTEPDLKIQQLARQQGADLRVFGPDEREFAEEWLAEP